MKRLLYVVNNLDYFLSHRACLAKEAQARGYRIVVATPDNKGSKKLESLGWQHEVLPVSRSGLNPFQEIKTLWVFNQIIRKIKPTLMHLVTIKPVIYGGLISVWYPHIRVISAVPGLGYVFTGEQWFRRVLRLLVGGLYRLALRGGEHQVIFQNRDDRAFFLEQGWIHPHQAKLILGAGVCPEKYHCLPEPDLGEKSASSQVTIVLPARLLKDKGVGEFIAAARALKGRAQFVLVGDVDQGNPASYAKEEIASWVDEGIIDCWGWCEDMLDVFARSHVVCLPSYREGLPRVLVEAASCGRTIVTTDVPGCREVVDDGKNGLLVPVRDTDALVKALSCLIENKALRQRLGAQAREKVLRYLSEETVVSKTMALYKRS